MGCDKDLATSHGIGSELFCQIPLQGWIELVFRFFDTQQGVGFWVVQQDQVGQHFDDKLIDLKLELRSLKEQLILKDKEIKRLKLAENAPAALNLDCILSMYDCALF